MAKATFLPPPPPSSSPPPPPSPPPYTASPPPISAAWKFSTGGVGVVHFGPFWGYPERDGSVRMSHPPPQHCVTTPPPRGGGVSPSRGGGELKLGVSRFWGAIPLPPLGVWGVLTPWLFFIGGGSGFLGAEEGEGGGGRERECSGAR